MFFECIEMPTSEFELHPHCSTYTQKRLKPFGSTAVLSEACSFDALQISYLLNTRIP